LFKGRLPQDVAIRWLTYDPSRASDYRAVLSREEEKELSAISHEGRRQLFMLGRMAARLLLSDRLGIDPTAVPLQRAADGGVDVLAQDLRVTITHTANYAVAAIGYRRVGVDLERIQQRRQGLEKRILHAQEWRTFMASPLDPVRRIMLYWTLKEASLKAMRTGFRLPACGLKLDINYTAQSAVCCGPNQWKLGLVFAEHRGCYLALAYEEK